MPLCVVAMSVLESDESAFQFLKMIMSGVGNIPPLSEKKDEFRQWLSSLQELFDSIGMGYLLISVSMPKCSVADSEASVKAFKTKHEKHCRASRWLRVKVKDGFPVHLKLAADQQPPTKTSDFLKDVTIPTEEIRRQITEHVTEYVDEEKVNYVEKLPALYTIIVYLKKRLLAYTAIEKTNLYNNFITTKWTFGDWDMFITHVRERRAAVVEAGMKLDSMAVQNVIMSNIPDHATAVVNTMLAKDPPATLDEIISTLETYFRNRLSNPRKQKEPAAASTPSDVQALFNGAPGGSSRGGRGAGARGRGGRGRGRAGRWRGGAGRGGAAGAAHEYRDGLPVCSRCKGIGHKQAVCPSNPSVMSAGKADDERKDVCSYCHKPGHNAKQCFKRKREERSAEPGKQGDDEPAAAVASADSSAMIVDLVCTTAANKLNHDDYLVDSGAKTNITNTPDHFVSYRKYNPKVRVNGINANHPLYADGCGDVELTVSVHGKPEKLTLHNVLLCVDCPVNLLTPAALLEEEIAYQCFPSKSGDHQAIGTKNGKIVYEAAQKPGSGRMLLKLWHEGGASTDLSAYPVVSAGTCANLNLCKQKEEKSSVCESSVFTHSSPCLHNAHKAHDRKIDSELGTWLSNDESIPRLLFESEPCEQNEPLSPTLSSIDASVDEKDLSLHEKEMCAEKDVPAVEKRMLDVESDDVKSKIVPAIVLKKKMSTSGGSERAKQREAAMIAHVKLGHCGARRLVKTMQVAQMPRIFTEQDAEHASSVCEACAAGRAKRVPHARRSFNRSKVPGETWHYDTFGPSRERSLGGASYTGIFVDEFSLYAYPVFAAHKNELITKLIPLIKQLRSLGIKITFICTDNAGEFNALWDFCKEVGIIVRLTVPGESAQNGLAERMIGVLTELWRCLRAGSGAKIGFWAEGFLFAVYLHNNTAHLILNWSTPNKMLFDRQIDLMNVVYPFGCSVWVKADGADKLGDRAVECCYLGVDHMNNRKGYRVWDLTARKVRICWNMKVIPSKMPWRVMKGGDVGDSADDDDADPFVLPDPQGKADEVKQVLSSVPDSVPAAGSSVPTPAAIAPASPAPMASAPVPVSPAVVASHDHVPVPVVSAPARPAVVAAPAQAPAILPAVRVGGSSQQQQLLLPPARSVDSVEQPMPQHNDMPVVDAEPLVQPSARDAGPAIRADDVGGHALRRTRGAPPTRFGSTFTYVSNPDSIAAPDLSKAVDEPLPASLSMALKGPNSLYWKHAYLKEMKSLRDYGVFEEVDSLPAGKNCLKGKLVLAMKKDDRGKIIKFKIRFVACGYAQKQFSDYTLTKADVAETRSFRLVLCAGVCMGGKFFQGDVSSAFLQSELEEEIYMMAPADYGRTRFVRLRRPLYGLKQSSRQWRSTFDTALRACDMTSCEREPGIYYFLDKGRIARLLVVHVDDFFGWSVSDELSNSFLKKLSALHEITYTTQINSFLGMDLSWQAGVVCLSQRTYISSFLKEFGYERINPKRLPAPKGLVVEPLSEEEKAMSLNAKLVHEYASRVGTLSYLGTHTRYDVSFIVNTLARFMHTPVARVSALLPDVFAYIARTRNCGLRYGGAMKDGIKLVGYCDASFPHSEEPYPQIGYLFYLIVGAIWNAVSWCSRRLKHVCLSTEEAELAAASEAAREAIALKSVLTEAKLLPADAVVCLYIDNNAAVQAASNGGYFPKLKHVNIEHKFIMQACAEHSLRVEWVSGKENPADVLTKALSAAELDSVRKLAFVDVVKHDH